MAKNSYVLGNRIARGGMAEIYMGKAVGEAAFQRICAIKRILPHYAQDKEFVEMFRDEAHICKRLQHANIVQVYDFTEVEGSYALIMEHIDGCDLRTLLSSCEAAKTRLTIPMSLYIAANSARALHYAHSKADDITKEALGIVHRDISPQNILLSYEGEVKITDFGIASAENKITETRPGVVKGKYSYMSPEQVAAKPLDGRSDIFSLAIVLWESLAMKRLFSGQTEVESIRKVQNCEIASDLRELNPEVDDELYKIVMKGLAKDRKDRYQSAAAFEKEILKYLHSRYSAFTSGELGSFLKRILAKKRGKTQDDIKETLSKFHDAEQDSISNAISNAGQPRSAGIEQGTGINRSTISPSTGAPGLFAGGQNATSATSSIRRRHSGQSQISVPHPVYSKSKSSSSSSFKKISLALSALLAVLLLLVFQTTQKKPKLNLRISSAPDTVSISINGKKIRSGYTKTPAKVSLKPGNYQIQLSRPGYESKTITVRGKAGGARSLAKINLKKRKNVRMVPVNIRSGNKKLFYRIDDGLFRGKTPSQVSLLSGRKHSITYSTGEQGKAMFKCTFTANRKRGGLQTVTVVTRSNGKSRCVVK